MIFNTAKQKYQKEEIIKNQNEDRNYGNKKHMEFDPIFRVHRFIRRIHDIQIIIVCILKTTMINLQI